MLSRMGVEAHIDVLKPKVNGVWNLHNQLSKTDLDFFIMLSSLAGLFGPASQSSYAAASVFQDAFAEFRNKQGLPAVSIDLGKVVDVGIIAEDSAARKSVEDTLTRALYKEDVFTAVRLAVEKPLQEIMLAGSTMVGIPPWTPEADPTLRSPMFCRYRRAAQVKSKTPTEREKAIASSSSVRTRVSEARTPAEGTEILYEALKYKCSSLLNISVEQFQPGNSLIDYGLDSLVAVELRKWLLREVDVAIPVLDLMGVGVSISELSQKLVRQITA